MLKRRREGGGVKKEGRGGANMHFQNKGLAPRDHNEHQEL
jgi:hypothetical protein